MDKLGYFFVLYNFLTFGRSGFGAHGTCDWPSGDFSFISPRSGCPDGAWERETIEYSSVEIRKSDLQKYADLDVTYSRENKRISVGYCSRSSSPDLVLPDIEPGLGINVLSYDDELETRNPWPNGQYCVKHIHAGEVCGNGLTTESVAIDVGPRKHPTNATEESPERYQEFCCNTGGSANQSICLPNKDPFILWPIQERSCQQVEGMIVKEEQLHWSVTKEEKKQFDLYRNEYSGPSMIYSLHTRQLFQHICYYEPIENEPVREPILLYGLTALTVLLVLVILLVSLFKVKQLQYQHKTARMDLSIIAEEKKSGKNIYDDNERNFTLKQLIIRPELAKQKAEKECSIVLQNVYLDLFTQSKVHDLLIPHEFVRLIEQIGEGAFGQVWKGTLIKSRCPTNKTVAIKTMKSSVNDETLRLCIQEGIMMSEFRHANVMNVIGISIDDQTNLPMLIMPYMDEGDLQSHLRKFRYDEIMRNNKPTTDSLTSMCLQIARGMEYLGAQKVVHRDLATRNCLINKQNLIKISDFGLSRDIYLDETYTQIHSTNVPVRWMAPESFIDRIYSVNSDMWSFGVTVWEVFTLAVLPYSHLNNCEVAEQVMGGYRLKTPQDCPEEIFDLLTKCWQEEARLRPSFEECITTLENLICKNMPYLDLKIDLISESPPDSGYLEPVKFVYKEINEMT